MSDTETERYVDPTPERVISKAIRKVLWGANLLDRDGTSEEQNPIEDQCTQAVRAALDDAGFVLMCQVSAGAKGETVSAPMEPLQSDIIADAALMKALGSVAWLADQEYRNDHSESTMIATGLLRELRDGYQRIAERRNKPDAAASALRQLMNEQKPRPMESAPEGKPVVLYGRLTGEIHGNFETDEFFVGTKRPGGGSWSVDGTDYYSVTCDDPKGWWPLPSPPENTDE